MFIQSPILNTIFSLEKNEDLYFGGPIVPDSKKSAYEYQKYASNTPEFLKEVSETFKGTPLEFSPAEVDFVIRSLTGDLGKYATQAVELLYGAIKGEEVSEQMKEKTVSKEGILTQIPILNKIFKEENPYYSPKTEHQKDIWRESTLESEEIRINNEEIANEIIDTISKLEDDDSKISTFNGMLSQLTPEASKKVMTILERKKTFEVIQSNASNDAKAIFIIKRLNEMEQEEKTDYLKELNDSKILTKDLVESFNRLYKVYGL